jgi:hypothetical protein
MSDDDVIDDVLPGLPRYKRSRTAAMRQHPRRDASSPAPS